MYQTTQRRLARILALLLLAATLFSTACRKTPPVETPTDAVSDTDAGGTDTLPEEDPYVRPTYEDLSFDLPARAVNEESTAKITVEGSQSSSDILLEFSGESGLFTANTPANSRIHDCTTCETCGFLEDGAGLYMGCANQDYMGVLVTLVNPISITGLTGLEATYKTGKDASGSVFRVMTVECLDVGIFETDCPSLAGAVEEYRTVDLNLDADDLADDDGNITGFQIFFRNKEKNTATLQSLRFVFSPAKFLEVDEVEGNFFTRGDVTHAIAETIAARFKASDIYAEITVEVDKYRQNNTKMDGSILYVATAVLQDGSTVSYEGKITIPAVSGVWLDTTTGSFGATHDSKGQWQTTFDDGGMVELTDNTIVCKEGLSTVEYTLIPADGVYDDPAHSWYAPQVLRMATDGFEYLFINAYADFGDSMTEGETYRLLVRGVTANENYVLHLDIPFTYSPADAELVASLKSALEKVASAGFLCPAETQDKAALVQEKLTALLNDPTLSVGVETLGEGLNSVAVRVTLSSTAEAQNSRLPAYSLDGEALKAVYAYAGAATTVSMMTFAYTDEKPAIELTAPYDGDRHVILASSDVYAMFGASIEKIESNRYPFKWGEYCHPVPAVLEWSGEEGKTYTVTLSKSPDLSDPAVYTVTGSQLSVYYLELGTAYYWQVTDGQNTSQTYTFTTEDGYARFIEVEGVSNFRDIGGFYTTDGYRVKQGMMYRSATLDGISEKGYDVVVNTLGIKTELDLRGSGSAALGEAVNRKVIAMQWYGHIFKEENYEVVRETIAEFANPENYPLNFHCAVGRDRTGTTSFLILGLLGVDEDILRREYYASLFSKMGTGDIEEAQPIINNINSLRTGLITFDPDGTLQQQIEAYLLRVGVTEAEIESIRAILLEGYEGTILNPDPDPDPEPDETQPEETEPETTEPAVIEAPFDEIPYTETLSSSHAESYGYSSYEVYTDEEAALAAGIPEGFSGSVMKLTSEGDYVGIGMDLTPWQIRLEDVRSMTVRYQTDVQTGELRLSNGLHFIVQTAIPETNTWVEYTVCDDGTGFRNDYRFSHVTNDDGTLGYFILYIRNKSGVPGTFYVDGITIELKES